ncbi:MAG: hypothetical protein MZV64_63290 [Ignavibacteriales bacterium]|nr:hypothetical protein [Ignavibacteriales bacterium]
MNALFDLLRRRGAADARRASVVAARRRPGRVPRPVRRGSRAAWRGSGRPPCTPRSPPSGPSRRATRPGPSGSAGRTPAGTWPSCGRAIFYDEGRRRPGPAPGPPEDLRPGRDDHHRPRLRLLRHGEGEGPQDARHLHLHRDLRGPARSSWPSSRPSPSSWSSRRSISPGRVRAASA